MDAPTAPAAPTRRTYDCLQVRRDGGVLHVTLDRPEARNAMTIAMLRELRSVLAEAQAGGASALPV